MKTLSVNYKFKFFSLSEQMFDPISKNSVFHNNLNKKNKVVGYKIISVTGDLSCLKNPLRC